MKKVLRNLVFLSIDIAMASLLSILNILFFKYAFCIEVPRMSIVVACFIIYFSFAWFTHKRTVGQAVLCRERILTRHKNKAKFVANLLDLSIICTVSLLLTYLLTDYLPIRYYWVFIASALLYYVLAYSTCQRTLGQALFNIYLFQNTQKPKWINVLLREILYKWGFILLIILLLNIFHYKNPIFNVVYAFLTYLFFKFYYQFTTNHNWWDSLAGTCHKMGQPSCRRYILFCVIFWIIGTVSFFSFKLIQNRDPHYTGRILGYNLHAFNPYYPVNENVWRKKVFIDNQSQSAKEYIFHLFEDYDIVVLGERTHTEMKQWDFIYDIVSDPRFINNVGHLFTEYGSNDQQELVDEYLNTIFDNDTTFNKATTNLLREFGQWPIWYNRNIFDFFKRLNLLEQTLPDSLKIREYFCDVNTFAPSIKTREEHLNAKEIHRDSAMAKVVIENFKQIMGDESRKKCLVIANYRHSWNDENYYKNIKDYKYFPNEASYIFDAFPNRVANVLINCYAFGNTGLSMINEPIRRGEWDKAFELCGNKNVGFDFKDSPFGEDDFELMPNFGKKKDVQFQDIYTGFVFITPLYEMEYKEGIPYTMDGFEEEYQRRLYLIGRDTSNMQEVIKAQKESDQLWDKEKKLPFFAGIFRFSLIYNNFHVIIYLTTVMIACLITLYLLITTIGKKRYEKR